MKEKTIYALGFFDGVHLGHQALLTVCRQLAAETGCKAGVVTFTSHPDTLVSGNTPPLINTTEDRKQLLTEHFLMDCVMELPFNESLRTMDWRDFIRMLRMQDGAGFVCGEDFRFGYNGEGTAEILAEYCKAAGLPCAIVPEQTLDGKRISSTYIRSLIEDGDMITAAQFLGHLHILSGEVVPGRHLGRTIDTPTANILLPEGVVVPKLGVYACLCDVDGRTYVAVTNIGSRPTVNGHQKRVEAWILDFDGCLYGKRIMLKFHKFLRPEQKFSSLKELKKQIQRDAGTAYMLLK